ncbi:MAG: zinc finger Ran-binding domain-containing protein [Candidatus Undinarchaeales archaeon]|jgi:hypothetical protein|nr:zinc finger Ran-binding domain-containing protein [Candidatus Undinarchaeales archaeon]MDP7493098.1 zinc finger Ran-binding domain-containing protein [Candidatus Undinarchaeales archaeon]
MSAPDPRRILAILPPAILAVGIVMLMLGVEKMVMDFKATFLIGVGALLALAGLGSALMLPSTAGDSDDEEVVVHHAPAEVPKTEKPAAPVEAHLSKEELETLSRVESEELDLKKRVDELTGALETARTESHDGLDAAGAGAAETAERIKELAARIDALEEQLAAPQKEPSTTSEGYEYGGAMAQPEPPPAASGGSIAERISPVGEAVRPPPEPTDDEEFEEDKGPEGFPCNTCGFVNKRRTAFCARCGAKM